MSSSSDDVADLLGVTFTPEQDARATRLLELADAVIGAHVVGLADEAIVDDVFTVTVWGDSTLLYLPYTPVTSATVTVDGVAFTDFTTTKRGALVRTDGRVWRGTVVVTATYGPAGDDLAWVAADMVKNVWVNPANLTQEVIGQRSASFDTEGRGMTLTEAHRKVLGEYRTRIAAV